MFRGPRGLLTRFDPGASKPLTEIDTVTCQHGPCNRLIEIPPGSLPTDTVAGRCQICWGIICLPCVERTRKFGCEVVEKWMDRVEKVRG